MDIRFSRHARNKLRLYKLAIADVTEVINSGERLNQGDKWESRQGKLRVIWAVVGPYVFVITVVTMEVAHPEGFLLTVTGNGFGKLTPISEYPLQKRAGSGVRTFKLTDKTGDVVATKIAALTQQVMMISAQGMVIQTPVKEKDPKKGITTLGRSTQGVKLMNLDEGDKLVAVTVFD